MNLPYLFTFVRKVRGSGERDELGAVAADLAGCDVRCVAVLGLDFGVEDLAAHEVDGFLAEEAEGFGDCDWRDT